MSGLELFTLPSYADGNKHLQYCFTDVGESDDKNKEIISEKASEICKHKYKTRKKKYASQSNKLSCKEGR